MTSTKSVRFSQADLDLFAAASHDRNPLHLEAAYARRTPMGQQVVFGILGAMHCLGGMEAARSGAGLASLTLDFDRPVFLDTDYHLVVDSPSVTRLMDGSTVLMKVVAEFADTPAAAPELDPATPRLDAANRSDAELTGGLNTGAGWSPDLQASATLAQACGLPASRGSALDWALLLLSSYIVGMEVPGERALYFKARFQFQLSVPELGALRWTAKVLSRNAMNLLRQDVTVSVGDTNVCNIKLSALVRPPAVQTKSADLPRSDVFAGKTVLLTGASRGLGAAIASALVCQGAKVFGSYLQGREAIETLASELTGESGKLIPLQGDASDPEWARLVLSEHGPPDYLILNACPTVRVMKAEPETLARIHGYIDQAFGLVSAPLAVFADQVRECTVLISSAYVEDPPKDFPHYVAAKAACEGYLQVIARQLRKPAYLIVRPPKLLTDMTNTPYGTGDAAAPERIAAALAARLLQPMEPGNVETVAV